MNSKEDKKEDITKEKYYQKNLIKKGDFYNNNIIKNYSKTQNQFLKLKSSVIDWSHIINITLNDSIKLKNFFRIQILSKSDNLILSDEIIIFFIQSFILFQKNLMKLLC
jgi:hypothetical protein